MARRTELEEPLHLAGSYRRRKVDLPKGEARQAVCGLLLCGSVLVWDFGCTVMVHYPRHERVEALRVVRPLQKGA